MKKIFTTLAITFGMFVGAQAQTSLYFDNTVFQSVNSGTTSITPVHSATAGLNPSDSALPCSHPGQAVSDTIYFTNFTTFSVATVNSLKIDSLYLPAGLTWATTHANNTFTTGEDGVIYVTGTTNVAQGVYKLRIIVDVDATIIGNLQNQNAETLAHLRYHVRITNPGCPCPAIIAADSSSVYTAYTCTDTLGVNDLSNNISALTVSPNPIANAAQMTFNSEVAGTYTMSITNLVGAVVSSKEVNIVNGHNELPFSRNGISAGMYLVNLTNGQSSVSRKVIFE